MPEFTFRRRAANASYSERTAVARRPLKGTLKEAILAAMPVAKEHGGVQIIQDTLPVAYVGAVIHTPPLKERVAYHLHTSEATLKDLLS